MRQLNRLLEVNDINMSRIEQEVPTNRVRKPTANQSRIETLIKRLETGRPSPITPMRYVEAIANLQTSKFKDTGDVDSDSDSEIEDVNGEAEEEPTQAAEEQAEPTPSQSDITCRVCMDREVNAIIQPCCHSICLPCGDIFKQQKKPCHICRRKIRSVQRFYLN